MQFSPSNKVVCTRMTSAEGGREVQKQTITGSLNTLQAEAVLTIQCHVCRLDDEINYN